MVTPQRWHCLFLNRAQSTPGHISLAVSGKPGSFSSTRAARGGMRLRYAHRLAVFSSSPAARDSALAFPPAHSIAISKACALIEAWKSSIFFCNAPVLTRISFPCSCRLASRTGFCCLFAAVRVNSAKTACSSKIILFRLVGSRLALRESPLQGGELPEFVPRRGIGQNPSKKIRVKPLPSMGLTRMPTGEKPPFLKIRESE